MNVLALDFDGTMIPYETSGQPDQRFPVDQIMPQKDLFIALLTALKRRGDFYIMVNTRGPTESVKAFLQRAGLFPSLIDRVEGASSIEDMNPPGTGDPERVWARRKTKVLDRLRKNLCNGDPHRIWFFDNGGMNIEYAVHHGYPDNAVIVDSPEMMIDCLERMVMVYALLPKLQDIVAEYGGDVDASILCSRVMTKMLNNLMQEEKQDLQPPIQAELREYIDDILDEMKTEQREESEFRKLVMKQIPQKQWALLSDKEKQIYEKTLQAEEQNDDEPNKDKMVKLFQQMSRKAKQEHRVAEDMKQFRARRKGIQQIFQWIHTDTNIPYLEKREVHDILFQVIFTRLSEPQGDLDSNGIVTELTATPFHIEERIMLIKTALDAGWAKPNPAFFFEMMTQIYRIQEMEKMQELMAMFPDLSMRDTKGRTLLHIACHGMPFQFYTRQYFTGREIRAFDLTSLCAVFMFLDFLIQKKCNLLDQDVDGIPPLGYLARSSNDGAELLFQLFCWYYPEEATKSLHRLIRILCDPPPDNHFFLGEIQNPHILKFLLDFHQTPLLSSKKRISDFFPSRQQVIDREKGIPCRGMRPIHKQQQPVAMEEEFPPINLEVREPVTDRPLLHYLIYQRRENLLDIYINHSRSRGDDMERIMMIQDPDGNLLLHIIQSTTILEKILPWYEASACQIKNNKDETPLLAQIGNRYKDRFLLSDWICVFLKKNPDLSIIGTKDRLTCLHLATYLAFYTHKSVVRQNPSKKSRKLLHADSPSTNRKKPITSTSFSTDLIPTGERDGRILLHMHAMNLERFPCVILYRYAKIEDLLILDKARKLCLQLVPDPGTRSAWQDNLLRLLNTIVTTKIHEKIKSKSFQSLSSITDLSHSIKMYLYSMPKKEDGRILFNQIMLEIGKVYEEAPAYCQLLTWEQHNRQELMDRTIKTYQYITRNAITTVKRQLHRYLDGMGIHQLFIYGIGSHPLITAQGVASPFFEHDILLLYRDEIYRHYREQSRGELYSIIGVNWARVSSLNTVPSYLSIDPQIPQRYGRNRSFEFEYLMQELMQKFKVIYRTGKEKKKFKSLLDFCLFAISTTQLMALFEEIPHEIRDESALRKYYLHRLLQEDDNSSEPIKEIVDCIEKVIQKHKYLSLLMDDSLEIVLLHMIRLLSMKMFLIIPGNKYRGYPEKINLLLLNLDNIIQTLSLVQWWDLLDKVKDRVVIRIFSFRYRKPDIKKWLFKHGPNPILNQTLDLYDRHTIIQEIHTPDLRPDVEIGSFLAATIQDEIRSQYPDADIHYISIGPQQSLQIQQLGQKLKSVSHVVSIKQLEKRLYDLFPPIVTSIQQID